jgi:ABC-type phosphate/phosphonate transport system permease subunit
LIHVFWATGMGWLAAISFAILPQVWPLFVSYTLLRFERNDARLRGAVQVGSTFCSGSRCAPSLCGRPVPS